MKRREPLNPDLTPLIDVVFILLVFFIVTSTFKKEETALNLALPSSEAEKIEIERKQVSIEVSKDKYAYNGNELTLDELETKLTLVKNKKRAVIVRIDKDVTYDRVVGILNALQKNSLDNLALVTKDETEKNDE